MTNILVVDDDARVLKSVERVLAEAGFSVITATNGPDALEIMRRDRPDLVVLDIIMPGMDGIEVCRRVRADPFLVKLPILFLTAKGRPGDVAAGLDVGGDDYLTKPFEVIELPARIRALLRRAPGGPLDPEADFVTVGALRIHSTRPELTVDGKPIELTAVEHRLLHYLMVHAGQPLPTERLLEDVWEYPPGVGNPKLVHVHIVNLRSKIEPVPDDPRYLRTVRGRGYLVQG